MKSRADCPGLAERGRRRQHAPRRGRAIPDSQNAAGLRVGPAAARCSRRPATSERLRTYPRDEASGPTQSGTRVTTVPSRQPVAPPLPGPRLKRNHRARRPAPIERTAAAAVRRRQGQAPRSAASMSVCSRSGSRRERSRCMPAARSVESLEVRSFAQPQQEHEGTTPARRRAWEAPRAGVGASDGRPDGRQ